MKNLNRSRTLAAGLFAAALLLANAASVLAEVHYVDVNGTNATPPYTNWITAGTNIQDAVDAAVAGDEVVVMNGTYASVGVGKPLNVRSVNGPTVTTIDGGGAIRCAYLASGASSLSGFTLTNGYVYGGDGGGAYGGTLNNCLLGGNSAHSGADLAGDLDYLGNGGGAAYCTLNNCILTGNSANNDTSGCDGCAIERVSGDGGGAYNCTLNTCTLRDNSANNYDYLWGFLFGNRGYYGDGGGAAYSTLNNCTLTHNSAVMKEPGGSGPSISYISGDFGVGGGAYHCMLNGCTLANNFATSYFTNHPFYDGGQYADGGGAAYSILNNCTLTGNSTQTYEVDSTYGDGGGWYRCTLNNCINFGNYAKNYCEDCYSRGHLGGNNWWGDPLFVDTNSWANLRLQPNSPCINAGNNSYVTNATDLDGNPRIAGGTVDIGAYEFQSPASTISYAWLQQFNLPINPATDAADADGDGVDNYHEWLAGTDPTDPLSSPAQLTIIPSGTNVILTWTTNAFGFTLQSTTNLASSVWSTNSSAPVVIGGQNIVTNPISGPRQFYRLSQ